MRLTFLLLLFSTSLFSQEMMLWSNTATDFSPTSISNLIAWWDASSLVTLSGSNVVSWEDKVGGRVVSQSSTSERPVFVSNAINSNPAIEFDGSNDNLQEFDLINFGNSITFIVICEAQSNSNEMRTVAFAGQTRDYLFIPFRFYTDLTTGFYARQSGNDESNTPAGNWALNTPYMFTGISVEGTSTDHFRNKIKATPTVIPIGSNYTIGSTEIDQYSIGSSRAGNTRFFDGYIAEVLIYDRNLTDSEVNQLFDDYFNPKYNLNTYPSGYVFCNNVITEISDVTSTTGRVWMDRNLGASQVATSSTDANAYGDLFQWGRFAEGYQCRNSNTTSIIATTAVPNAGNSWDGLFITPPSSPFNWLNTLDDNLWQGVSGVNNPCPSGYRIPSEAEWEIERASWSSNNSTGAYASPLKLTLSGSRSYGSGGPISYLGVYGFYWSSSVSGIDAKNLRIYNSDASMRFSYRANGFEVRCIKEETPLVQNDLVLHLDASDPASYPGTGTTWTDLSPEGNDGTIYGATFSNNTFVFDGVNDYVDVGNDASLNFGTGDFTVQVYYKRYSNAVTNLRLLAKGADTDEANSDRAGYGIWSSDNLLSFGVNPTGTRTIIDVPGLTINQDYLVTGLVERGVSQRAYINTILKGTATAPVGSVTGIHPLNIGRNPRSSNFYWDGEIKKVLIYNRALSEGEVKQNYNAMVYPYPPGYTPCEELTEIVDVTSTTGAVWMDRNLGASRVATSSTDAESYGDLYQWGRFADGHQCRNSATTSTNATTSVPFTGGAWDGLFILESNSPNDWLTPQDDNLWQGVNGVNNPCPSGYRIPTESEWQEEDNTFIPNNSAGAYSSPLKLPVTGYRNRNSGSLFYVGERGIYWSSLVSGFDARYLYFHSVADMDALPRAHGLAIRCIKD